MRITNKIMQSNTLYNINQNKELQDKLNTQITTRKKVTKPSDDPIVAIRALRLRSNLNQVSQYYEKNIPDASQWIQLTETAIDTTVGVISSMIDECVRGSKGSLTSSDRGIILESLRQLKSEVYATGDSDYAGRTIFTGYRTDMKLSFQKNETVEYSIKEQLTNKDISAFTFVDDGNIGTVNETTYKDAGIVSEQEIAMFPVNRFRLSYDNLDKDTVPVIEQVISYDADENPITSTVCTPVVMSKDADPNPYRIVGDEDYADYDPDAAIFVPETGELLLGKNIYDSIMKLTPETEIQISYSKNEWKSGDLRPEHYFACESDGVKYNESYLTKNGRNNKQVIAYDVGFNQTIEVNTTADEIYLHGIGRAVDEIISMLDEISKVDTTVKKLESMQGNSVYDQDQVELRLDAAKKAQSFLNDTIQKKFESSITEFQGYLDKANAALTASGNRGLRLELVENRLGTQKTSFQQLTSENEDADLAELAVELKSAELTYSAALASTGKLLQTSLLDYL